MMITIKNEFHNTEARIWVVAGEQLTASQTVRAARKLCGIRGCQCGAFERDPNHNVDYTGEDDGVFLPTFYE